MRLRRVRCTDGGSRRKGMIGIMNSVGILCCHNREMEIARTLFTRLRQLPPDEQIPFLVFSIGNVRLPEKTADGEMVTPDGVTIMRAELPGVIFNFAVQYTKENIRRMREFTELEDRAIVNSSNEFDQRAIMQMLDSGQTTRKYRMPAAEFTGRLPAVVPDHFILRPAYGASVSRMIYGRRAGEDCELLNWQGNPVSRLSDIREALAPVIRTGSWMLLDAPELRVRDGRYFGVRDALQRGGDGRWEILQRDPLFHDDRISRRPDPDLDAAVLDMAGEIGCYLPDMGLCFVDAAQDTAGRPVFLGFGGWQNRLLGRRQSGAMQERLCRNILRYSKYLKDN